MRHITRMLESKRGFYYTYEFDSLEELKNWLISVDKEQHGINITIGIDKNSNRWKIMGYAHKKS